jgi:hypothetical protein
MYYYDDYWSKSIFDQNDTRIYYQSSDGYWERVEYNEFGNKTYYEDSSGYIRGKRNV